MDRAMNPNCYPHLEGNNKSLLVGDIEDHCEETNKLLQNQNEDDGLDAKLKESVLSILKSEFEKLKQETQISNADLESNCNTKLEKLHDSEAQQETTETMKLRANFKRNNIEVEENEGSIDFGVEEDVFSLMMFSPFWSLMYWTGIFVFLFQITLVVMLYQSLSLGSLTEALWKKERNNTFDIPYDVTKFVRVGQYLVAFLSIAFQTDIHDAIHYILLLRKGNQTNWKILAENQALPQELSDLSIMRDGECDGGEYNTEECGWEEGDCLLFEKKYPNCTVDSPWQIGDGYCFGGEYNTEECGWEGGDCDKFYRKYPNCKVEYPHWIEDGYCHSWGNYNTEECGWDGGDCL